MGWRQTAVVTNLVVIYGTGTVGLFQYNGKPALGNPPIAWSVPPGVTKDAIGNTLPASGGFASENTSNGIWAQLGNGAVDFGSANPSTTAKAGGGVVFQDTTTPGGQPSVLVISPRTQAVVGTGTVWVAVMSESQDTTKPGQVLIGPQTANPTPATPAMLEVQGTIAANTVEAIVSGAAETWHTISSGFPAGWSGTVSYRQLAEAGSLMMVEVSMTLANGTVVTNPTTITNAIPAAYLPFSKPFPVYTSGAGAPGAFEACFIATSTGLTYNGAGFTAGAGGAFIQGRQIYSTAV